MSKINVLWVIDHVCYDGSLHGGGRLYWNVLPRFDTDQVRIVPCLLRADDVIREVFTDSPVPVRILDRTKFDLRTLGTFLNLIKTENIHVMHLHCYGASTFGRIAGLLTGIPTVIHDYDTEVYFPYPRYLSIADRLLAPVTRHAVAASPMVKEFLVAKRKVDRRKISIMFHAVPPDKYMNVSSEGHTRIRQTLEIEDEYKLVGTVTKLGPQRGNECLLDSIAHVVAQHRNVVFLLIYKPTRFHRLPNKRYVEVTNADTAAQIIELKSRAERLHISEHVRFVEISESSDELVDSCEFVVAPFLSERFSSVPLLEAMAKAKPVVATDLGESREIVRNGINGYLVTPGDVPELAQAISRLLSDPAQQRRMGREALAVAEQHSADECARRLERLYLELAGNGATVKGRNRLRGAAV